MRTWGLAFVLTFGWINSSHAAEPTVSPWLTDWPTAQKIAKHENKPIFAVLH